MKKKWEGWRNYSWLPNSNPRSSRTKFDFPGFLSNIYCIFYIPLVTRTLDNTNHVLSAWKVEKKQQQQQQKQRTEVQNMEKTNKKKKIKTRILRVNSLFLLFCHSTRFNFSVRLSLLIKLKFLNSFFRILIYISCCPWSKRMLWQFFPQVLGKV